MILHIQVVIILLLLLLFNLSTTTALWPFGNNNNNKNLNKKLSPLPIPSHTQIVRTWTDEQPSTTNAVISFFDGDITTRGTMLSTCLTNVAASVPARCIGMTDDEYMRFAIGLTNCHLQKSGKPIYTCADNGSIDKCTKQMSDGVFTVYTMFYTQTISICLQLQQDIRNSAAQETLTSLILASDRTVDEMKILNNRAVEIRTKIDESAIEHARVAMDEMKSLEEISKRTDEELKSLSEISEKTTASLDEMEKFSRIQQTISNSLDNVMDVTNDVADGLTELTQRQHDIIDSITQLSDTTTIANLQQHQLVEQQKILADEQEKMRVAHQEMINSLSFITKIQLLIFGEVMEMKSIVWYCSMIFVIIAVSSCTYTAHARGYLFLGLILTLVIERLIGIISDYNINVLLSMPVGRNICFFGYAIIIIIYSISIYNDPFKIVDTHMKEIKQYIMVQSNHLFIAQQQLNGRKKTYQVKT